MVPLRQQKTIAVVQSKTLKPSFATKPILQVLDYHLSKPGLDLVSWMMGYYPAPVSTIMSLFVPSTLAHKHSLNNFRILKPKKYVPPELTPEQKTVLKKIQMSHARNFLLHGETGSGKTRIYLELAKQTLSKGQSALILTPEISLTPQLVRDFKLMFGSQVITSHSNLSAVGRRTAWQQVFYAKQPVVVIGPRSALFAPFTSLGLIVIDEAHESAYKQEQAPYYHAHRVAGKLAQLHKARLIMGTATPNVADYYIAVAKGAKLLRMQEPAIQSVGSKLSIQIINSRDRDLFRQNQQLSDPLLEAVKTALDNKEQSLLFLNRRGTARLVLCQVCGWQVRCPNCDLPLTYHGDTHTLRCHTCGFRAPSVTRCPVCTSTDIIYKNIGTKSIVDQIRRIFPQAQIGRYDSDNSKAERFEQHYDDVSSGKVDILVGTQILAKGLDLPKLRVVGVVTADTSLTFPDYTAEERTYQLITQIIGRVGRGHRVGQAILQTHNPDSPIIQAAVHKDWKNFYDQQLTERHQFMFPPFCYLLKLTCVRKSQTSASQSANNLKSVLLKRGWAMEIIGPAPSFYEKTKVGYRWQLIVKSKSRQILVDVINDLPANWIYDLDPTSLL
jgi:primosomal protein N' (replication factor Y)